MDGGKKETGLQRAAFLLLVVCAPVKQLFSGWCESHLERRRVSDPLTAQTFADVALVTFRSGTLQFLIPEGQPRGCSRARGRGDALRTHAGLPARPWVATVNCLGGGHLAVPPLSRKVTPAPS